MRRLAIRAPAFVCIRIAVLRGPKARKSVILQARLGGHEEHWDKGDSEIGLLIDLAGDFAG
jgi:hypothetical protein